MIVSLTSGCAGQLETNNAFKNVNNGIIEKGPRPECEVPTSEYALDTKVIAFEIVSNTGLSMGFDLISKFLRFFQFSFRAKTGRLSLAMSLYDPMKPDFELMNVLGQSKMVEREFKFDFSFSKAKVGFDNFYKTPISLLTERGLEDTLKNMTNSISTLEDEWTTHVVAIPTATEVIVPVGSFTGLRVGDFFEIYNVQHIWTGVPCESEHLIARKTTSRPIAIAMVTQVDKNASVLTVYDNPYAKNSIEVNSLAQPIELGAVVEIHKLQQKDEKDIRKLFRSLEIRAVEGAEMEFGESHKVDISQYVKDQIRAVAHKHNFTIYQRKAK